MRYKGGMVRAYGLMVCAWIAMGLMAMGLMAEAQGSGAAAPAAAAEVLTQAKVFPFAEMPARKMPNGAESRDTLHGLLATGEAVSVHESLVPAGMKANPQHVIQHSEIITVLEGTVAFEHGDKSEKVPAGGVIYVALGTLHTVRNIGDVPARYVVVAIGGDVKK